MDLIHRLNHHLREAARQTVPAALNGEPITVAEIYQRLIPYRVVRGELGILELAQYEHALLRLLAGESGYLRVESPEAREELRRELANSNPILGIYRDFAAVPVRLVADPASEADQTDPWPAPPPPPAPAPVTAAATPAPPPRPEPRGAPPRTAACVRCREPLPDAEDVHYCPHCGAAQGDVPCDGCGAAVRGEWSYCVRCGTPRPHPRSTA